MVNMCVLPGNHVNSAIEIVPEKVVCGSYRPLVPVLMFSSPVHGTYHVSYMMDHTVDCPIQEWKEKTPTNVANNNR